MLCRSCGAAFPPKEAKCPYCGAARPSVSPGSVSRMTPTCPVCEGPLTKVPVTGDYYKTETRLTKRALELQAEHEAGYEQAVSAHRARHEPGCGLLVALFSAFVGTRVMEISFLCNLCGWIFIGGLAYAALQWFLGEVDMPVEPPLPPEALETEEYRVQAPIRSHTGMVLRCSGCGWEDWAINYDAEAQGAERAAAAAEKAARAAEDQAEAVQRQAQAQEDLRDLEWYRERENR